MKILILGDGLLAKELIKITNWDYISRKKDNFDIRDKNQYSKYFIESFHGSIFVSKYDVIVNCVAYTDTFFNDRTLHWDTNYKSVVNLADFCSKNSIKLVQISSDYIYANSVDMATEEDVPCHNNSWYTYTKLLADAYVQLNPTFLILRGTHKPTPFPYESAWINQIGNFDYVNVMAQKYVQLILQNANGVYNVGTEVKTMLDLAKKTKNSVGISLTSSPIPRNTTMSINKTTTFLKDKVQ